MRVCVLHLYFGSVCISSERWEIWERALRSADRGSEALSVLTGRKAVLAKTWWQVYKKMIYDEMGFITIWTAYSIIAKESSPEKSHLSLFSPPVVQLLYVCLFVCLVCVSCLLLLSVCLVCFSCLLLLSVCLVCFSCQRNLPPFSILSSRPPPWPLNLQ